MIDGLNQLTTKANPGSTIKRHIVPSRSDSRPPLGLEFRCIRSVEVFTAVQSVAVVADNCVFGDKEGRLSVWSTANREDRVTDCGAGVCWDDGEEAEGWIILARERG